jgi:hypothetical protein
MKLPSIFDSELLLNLLATSFCFGLVAMPSQNCEHLVDDLCWQHVLNPLSYWAAKARTHDYQLQQERLMLVVESHQKLARDHQPVQ